MYRENSFPPKDILMFDKFMLHYLASLFHVSVHPISM